MDKIAQEKVNKLMEKAASKNKKNPDEEVNVEAYKQSDGSYLGDLNLSEIKQADDTWAQVSQSDEQVNEVVTAQETAETIDKLMKNAQF